MGPFSILFGAFEPEPCVVVAAALGLVLAVIYALRMMQETFFGPPTWEGMRDLDDREAAVLGGGSIAIVIALGLYPMPILEAAQGALSAALEPTVGGGL